jgi:POT family proton-dependent oligopeptide transporter
MSTRLTCALVLLCVVQGCERFAFFAMLPLFVLYLHHRHGFTEPSAILLFGVFQSLSYVGGLPAGVLIDRRLGPLPALLVGGSLLTLGYAALALDRDALLWPALGLMVAGHSFVKPSSSVLLGDLFRANDPRRERGFLWLHFAINIAGMAGPLCGDWSSAGHRWERLFLVSSVVMFVGTFALAVGMRLLPIHAESTVEKQTNGSEQGQRERWWAVWLLCASSIVFWLTAQQAGSSLVLFAESHTERTLSAFGRVATIGPSHFASLHGLLVLLLLPFLMMGMSHLRRCNAEPSTPAKMIWGYVATAAAFALLMTAGLLGADSSRVSPLWLFGCYLLLSLAELLLLPLGMSLITQIAPSQRTSQAIGLWFAASAVGNGLSGAAGLLWEQWPSHRYFAALVLVSLGAAAVLLSCLSRLERGVRNAR